MLDSRRHTWEAPPPQTTPRRVAQPASDPAARRRITREDVLTVAERRGAARPQAVHRQGVRAARDPPRTKAREDVEVSQTRA